MFRSEGEKTPGPEDGSSPDAGVPLMPSMPSLDSAVVIAVPGSFLFSKGVLRLSWLGSLSRAVQGLRALAFPVALVVGESAGAQSSVNAARQVGVESGALMNYLAHASQLHAHVLSKVVANVHEVPVEGFSEASLLMQSGKTPVLVGRVNEHSAESRAALLAESLNARLVILTSHDLPSKTFSHARFSRMASEVTFKAGKDFIVDPFTATVLARSSIETLLVPASKVEQLEDAVQGKRFDGTRVISSLE